MTTKIIMRERFAFSAAHHLPTFPEGHKCRRVHGHTWEVVVDVEVAPEDVADSGCAIDHTVLRRVAWKVIGQLDHQLINEIEGLERGLAEDILAWLAVQLRTPIEDCLGMRVAQIELIEHSSSEGARVEHSKIWKRGE